METRKQLDSKFIETPIARETVLFANTPTFLLERLRKDSSTSYVSHELSTDELLENIREISTKTPSSPSELVTAYVLLVALTLKDDRKHFIEKFRGINLERIQWGDELRKMITESEPSNNFLEIKFPKIGSHDPEPGITSSRSRIILTDK